MSHTFVTAPIMQWRSARCVRAQLRRGVIGIVALITFLGCYVQAHALTFTVTSVDDTNGSVCVAPCTLRQAINAANLDVAIGTHRIEFDIGGSGADVISPASAHDHAQRPDDRRGIHSPTRA